MMQYAEIMRTVKSSDVMKRQWDNYRKDFDYAAGIEFEETCDAVIAMMDELVSGSRSRNPSMSGILTRKYSVFPFSLV